MPIFTLWICVYILMISLIILVNEVLEESQIKQEISIIFSKKILLFSVGSCHKVGVLILKLAIVVLGVHYEPLNNN